ncbi:MAG: CopG family transcriptional regulator [Anaerovoracaceae bacterium]
MLDREVKQNQALLAMLGVSAEAGKEDKEEKEVKAPKAVPCKKRNPAGYARNRGKGGTKPMSYYISNELVTAINVAAAKSGKTKSELVSAAITLYLKEEHG